MSLLPYQYQLPFLWPISERQPLTRLLDQGFGLGIEDDLMMLDPLTRSNHFMRPWHQLSSSLRDVSSSIKSDKEKFQVNLDVQHFAPEEISVKVVDGFVVVEGKHEEKQDQHGYISRQFVRRYSVPTTCDLDAVESKLSSDGVLTVTAPKIVKHEGGERIVAIAQTGPVRKEVKGKQSAEIDGSA